MRRSHQSARDAGFRVTSVSVLPARHESGWPRVSRCGRHRAASLGAPAARWRGRGRSRGCWTPAGGCPSAAGTPGSRRRSTPGSATGGWSSRTYRVTGHRVLYWRQPARVHRKDHFTGTSGMVDHRSADLSQAQQCTIETVKIGVRCGGQPCSRSYLAGYRLGTDV